MSISNPFKAIMLLAGFWPNYVFAECTAEMAFDFMHGMVSIDWLAPTRTEFDTTEGPGYRETYSTGEGLERVDERYCTSYYCLASVAMRTPMENGVIYFIQWGGANNPGSNERSVVYLNRSEDSPCLVNHSGGHEFRDGAVQMVEGLMKSRG